MKNTFLKILVLCLCILFVTVVFAHYHLWAYLSLDGFNHYHQQVLDYERQHVVTFMLAYILAYVLLIACCIPGTILFDLLAGFIYGPIVALALVLGCYLCGAILNFLLVRYFLKDICHKRFFHLRGVVIRGGGGMRSLAVNLIGLRFIPVVPFWLLNILAVVLEIPLWIFIITTFLGIIPSSIIYVLIGNGVRGQLMHNQQLSLAMFSDPKFWLPLVVMALLILVPNYLKVRAKKNPK